MIADEAYAADALVDLAPNVPTNNLDDGKGGGFGGGHAAPPLPQQNGNWFHEFFRYYIDFTEFLFFLYYSFSISTPKSSGISSAKSGSRCSFCLPSTSCCSRSYGISATAIKSNFE